METCAGEPSAAVQNASDGGGGQFERGNQRGREGGPQGRTHEREVHARSQGQGVQPGDAAGVWPGGEAKREREDAGAGGRWPEQAREEARGPRRGRVVQGRHGSAPGLPAGINLDVSDPRAVLNDEVDEEEAGVPHQAAKQGGRSRPNPAAWCGRVAAPDRAHSRKTARATLGVARIIGGVSSIEDNWRRNGERTGKGGCCPFPVLERILVQHAVTREPGARGHERGVTSRRRSGRRRRRRRPRDRPACEAK